MTRGRIELHFWIVNHLVIIPTFAIEFASIASSSDRIISYKRQLSHILRRYLRHHRRPIYTRLRRIRSGGVSSASIASCVVARKGVGILSRGHFGWKLIGARPKWACNSIPYHSKVPGRHGLPSQGRTNACQRDWSSNILDPVIAKSNGSILSVFEYQYEIISWCEYYRTGI